REIGERRGQSRRVEYTEDAPVIPYHDSAVPERVGAAADDRAIVVVHLIAFSGFAERTTAVTAVAEFGAADQDVRPEVRDEQRAGVEAVVGAPDSVRVAAHRETGAIVGGAQEDDGAVRAAREDARSQPHAGLAAYKGELDPRRSGGRDARRYA